LPIHGSRTILMSNVTFEIPPISLFIIDITQGIGSQLNYTSIKISSRPFV